MTSADLVTVPASASPPNAGASPLNGGVDAWTSHPYRVVTKAHELVGTVTLDLVPVDPDRAIGHWAPGQFTMMWVFGVGEVAISISGQSAVPGGVVQTIRAVGSVTNLLAEVHVGSVVGVRGPYGTGWEVDECAGHDVVVVAGGLGLAPLRPAIRRLLADRSQFGHIDILVGARSPRDLLYVEELDQWGAGDDTDVHISVDHATRGWPGHVGVVTQLFGLLAIDPANARALVCGPEIMMRFAADGLVDRGIDGRHIRLSLERTMQCGVGLCGHCQLGPLLLCRDGPVVTWEKVAAMVRVREL